MPDRSRAKPKYMVQAIQDLDTALRSAAFARQDLESYEEAMAIRRAEIQTELIGPSGDEKKLGNNDEARQRKTLLALSHDAVYQKIVKEKLLKEIELSKAQAQVEECRWWLALYTSYRPSEIRRMT